jgi:hypothetical protein
MKSHNLTQSLKDYQEALRSWLWSGRKGTMPRKVRHNSSIHKHAQRSLRVKRDRLKRKAHKVIQSKRMAQGQDIRTGR